MIGRVARIGIIAAAAIMVVVTLVQWEIRPQTDDATVRAILWELLRRSTVTSSNCTYAITSWSRKATFFFLIDPRPYKIALERARATLALTHKEVDA